MYAQAFRLLDAVAMFGALVGGLLLPMFSKMIKNREAISPIVNLAVMLLFIPSIVIAVSSLLYDREIMELLYHSHIEDSADILGLLMTGFIGIATTYIFGTLLTANGSIRKLNIMAAGGMVLNISLNLILIPQFFALGSAFASMVTQLATALAQVIIAAQIFHLRPSRQFIVKTISFIGVVIAVGVLSTYIGNKALGYFGMILFSVLSAFFLRLINLRDLYQIFALKE